MKDRTPVARRMAFALSLPELSLLAIVGWHLIVLQQVAAAAGKAFWFTHTLAGNFFTNASSAGVGLSQGFLWPCKLLIW